MAWAGPVPPACAVTSSPFSSYWQAKTEEQIAAEEAWYETDKVWLVHKDGFSLGEFRGWVLSFTFRGGPCPWLPQGNAMQWD